jgi:hypothetical protein
MGAYIGQAELINEAFGNVYKNKTKLGNTGPALNDSVLTSMRVLDEQNHLSKFTWHNLPKGLNANLIERILYYRGRGMFFYMPSNETFYFLPFALSDSIDVYGRYTGCTPIPFTGNGDSKGDKAWINGLNKKPQYDIILPQDLTYSDFIDSCVILNDYSQQLSQTIIPRYQLQEPLLQVMAEIIPFCRTNLLNSTGISGVYIQNQDEQASISAANHAMTRAAINGEKWIGITSSIEPKELTSTPGSSPQEYLMALQAFDNYRLSLHGLTSGGLFQKGSHMLQAEQDMNANRAKSVLDDGLYLRQEFCNIVNSIWPLGIWCTISESAIGVDKNQDGEISKSIQPQFQETNVTEESEVEVEDV